MQQVGYSPADHNPRTMKRAAEKQLVKDQEDEDDDDSHVRVTLCVAGYPGVQI